MAQTRTDPPQELARRVVDAFADRLMAEAPLLAEITRLPPGGNLVPITVEEAAYWLTRHGQIMTLTRDGQTFRVVDPWERGDE